MGFGLESDTNDTDTDCDRDDGTMDDGYRTVHDTRKGRLAGTWRKSECGVGSSARPIFRHSDACEDFVAALQSSILSPAASPCAIVDLFDPLLDIHSAVRPSAFAQICATRYLSLNFTDCSCAARANERTKPCPNVHRSLVPCRRCCPSIPSPSQTLVSKLSSSEYRQLTSAAKIQYNAKRRHWRRTKLNL